MKTIHVIRTDGTEEAHEAKVLNVRKIYGLIGADCLDTVNLRDGRVMLVDDTGMIEGKLINAKATALYHSACVPGTMHQIHGDVAITLDADW
jgi:hypothetical protein